MFLRIIALLRDKVATEAKGEAWSIETSPARNYLPVRATSYADLSAASTSKSSSGSDVRLGNGMTLNEVSSSRDKYFENIQVLMYFLLFEASCPQASNASRPDNLPPSQGHTMSHISPYIIESFRRKIWRIRK